jgi:UDP-GlcNAc:undecaprenyl-phosphate GlcNAc-1-phosphate transferase
MHIEWDATTVGSVFAALLGAFAILMNARSLGERLRIMDHPDSVRKRHARVTPLAGGIAIMVPFIAWCAFTFFRTADADAGRLLLAVTLCGAGAALIGFADDQSSTSPFSRILALVQLTLVALVIDPNLLPAQFDWGSFAPTPLAPWFAIAFITVAMVGLVNAVNMADGQDGVVGGMFVIWASCIMLVSGGTSTAVAAVLLVTSLAVLMFNLGGRTFLGDTGSYGVTFVFALLALRMHDRWGVTVETVVVWFFVPVVDCLRLMISRAAQGKSPFEGDHDHFHHRLADKFGKDGGLAVYLALVAVSSVTASLMPHMALVCLVVLASIYFSFAWLTVEPAEAQLGAAETDDPTKAGGNVVSMGTKDTASPRRK